MAGDHRISELPALTGALAANAGHLLPIATGTTPRTTDSVRLDVLLGGLSRLGRVFRASDPKYNIDVAGGADGAGNLNSLLDEAKGVGAVIVDGTVKCSSTILLPSNTTLIFPDRSCLLSFTWSNASGGGSGGPVYMQNSDTANGNINIRLYGLNMQGAGNGTPFGNASVPASGLLLRKGSHYHVHFPRFYRVPGIGCSPQGIDQWSITDFEVLECGRDGITGYWYDTNLTNGLICRGVVNTVGDDAIAIHSQGTFGTATARPKGINISDVSILSHTTGASNMFGRGLCLTGVEGVNLSNINIESTPFDGLYIQQDDTSGLTSRYVNATNINIREAGQVGDGSQPSNGLRTRGATDVELGLINIVHSKAHGGMIDSGSKRITIDGYRATNCGTTLNTHFGLEINGTSGVVDVEEVKASNVDCVGSAGCGVRVWYAAKTSLLNVTTKNNGAANVNANTDDFSAGIYCEVGAQEVRITNGRSYDTAAGGSKKQSYGLRLKNATGSTYELVGGNYSGNTSNPGISAGTAIGTMMRRGVTDDSDMHDRDTSGVKRYSGGGSPETVVTAPVGSTYSRTDGAAGTCLYVKESGTGNTGWIAK